MRSTRMIAGPLSWCHTPWAALSAFTSSPGKVLTGGAALLPAHIRTSTAGLATPSCCITPAYFCLCSMRRHCAQPACLAASVFNEGLLVVPAMQYHLLCAHVLVLHAFGRTTCSEIAWPQSRWFKDPLDIRELHQS